MTLSWQSKFVQAAQRRSWTSVPGLSISKVVHEEFNAVFSKGRTTEGVILCGVVKPCFILLALSTMRA